MKKFAGMLIAVLFAGSVGAQTDVHTLATKVDAHYNRLSSLRASFTERYSGMGQNRSETGSLLLRKPGRMRWSYAGGKLFVLDGKYAVSYVPGDTQAQRIPAKQLDDIRSPLRFLLGHTRLEKELDHLTVAPGPDGTLVLAGSLRYATGTDENRVQNIAIRIVPATGVIAGLQLRENAGTTTDFDFRDMQENVPATDSDFRFAPPPGVSVIDGMPPI